MAVTDCFSLCHHNLFSSFSRSEASLYSPILPCAAALAGSKLVPQGRFPWFPSSAKAPWITCGHTYPLLSLWDSGSTSPSADTFFGWWQYAGMFLTASYSFLSVTTPSLLLSLSRLALASRSRVSLFSSPIPPCTVTTWLSDQLVSTLTPGPQTSAWFPRATPVLSSFLCPTHCNVVFLCLPSASPELPTELETHLLFPVLSRVLCLVLCFSAEGCFTSIQLGTYHGMSACFSLARSWTFGAHVPGTFALRMSLRYHRRVYTHLFAALNLSDQHLTCI
ncbi:hypothetical protein DFH06DRAFT_768989 [Mycena polygramma]|nr:hypothetical protein DFH06DRAFT_768989 [Mycena polygramma]